MNLRQPSPGVLLWRSDHGYVFLVTNTATHDLGDGEVAQRLWRAADPEIATSLASVA